MNAAFFGLAVFAALNPKLLIIDLILATNQRPRLMFACFLLGGMGLAIGVGLLDVSVLHLDAIKTQNHSGGGLDLALGIPLFIVGALLATNHLHIHRQQPHRSPKPPSKLERWVQRALHEPRYGLALIIGLAVGVPGVSYLLALHHLVASKTAAAIAVVSVLVFSTINFALVIVPVAFLRVHPRRTEKHRAIQGLDRQPRVADRGRRRPARGRIHGGQRYLATAELTSSQRRHLLSFEAHPIAPAGLWSLLRAGRVRPAASGYGQPVARPDGRSWPCSRSLTAQPLRSAL